MAWAIHDRALVLVSAGHTHVEDENLFRSLVAATESLFPEQRG
ncbi:MAG: hypothetical protein ABJX32_02025 [Tateyamaria sp.]